MYVNCVTVRIFTLIMQPTKHVNRVRKLVSIDTNNNVPQEIKDLKAEIADLFINREKLQVAIGQNNQQLQIKINKLQKEQTDDKHPSSEQT